MGFFGNLKEKMGFSGVDIALDVPVRNGLNEGQVSGTVTLTTKEVQNIAGVRIRVIQREKAQPNPNGPGASPTMADRTLGETVLPETFTLQPGDTKQFPFQLAFQSPFGANGVPGLADNNAAEKAVNFMAKYSSLDQAGRFNFYVSASVIIEGVSIEHHKNVEIWMGNASGISVNL